jgi:circadian clock protein KaiC
VRGEKALFISFDETRRNFERRADALAMPIRSSLANGQLTFMRVDPAELSPGEMADIIRHRVGDGVRAIVLDSLSGYQHAMPEENNLLLHLHELLTYLNQQGVLTILVLAHTMVDGTFSSPEYTTYLADTVLLVRPFEAQGDIKRALSVLKKRTGAHERTIRELFFDADGLRVGAPLTDFSNLMAANPVYSGSDVFLSPRAPAPKP